MMAKKQAETASDIGRRLIQQEIKGLEAVHASLGKQFDEAVEHIQALGGRLIVSGMGKSGHIARKIAATFASTGTPAYFVHPAEASHGDLGMITEGDALLLLSNSGETAELRDMIAYAKRFSIYLIAMVRKEPSTLVSAADLALVLPDVAEASPVNAPTTSTTMMLALGDALAVAVLERKGFSVNDFHTFHPGGKLGKAFIRVDDIMHKNEQVPLVNDDEAMSKVLLEITAKSFGCAGVLAKDGTLAGIITDGDLRRHMSPELVNLKAHEVMTKSPVSISPDMLAAEALGIMNNEKRPITSVFVVEKGKPVGILHVHDCLRAGVM